MRKTYILGGYQTDFARNVTKESVGIAELLEEAVLGALEATDVDASHIEVVHIGNLAGELFCGQAQLGGIVAGIDPAFVGVPTARHEAACASGSVAALAAMAELEAERYDLALVTGVEIMRNVDGETAAQYLGAAACIGQEAPDAVYPWPALFSAVADAYDERYGLQHAHLARIAELNLENAKRNPKAQRRGWELTPEDFSESDEANPLVEGRLRKMDCGPITDGAAAVVLASQRFAEGYANRAGTCLDQLPVIYGWGHHTAPMLLQQKLELSRGQPYLFPHVRQTIVDAYRRAGVSGPEDLDVIETHDCFTITEYVSLDHFGLTEPGGSWQAIEEGRIDPDGPLPVNPSGGLFGLGHPVGATGVRMLLDAGKQVTGDAGAYQVEGARTVATLNVGGSFTTAVSLVVGRNT